MSKRQNDKNRPEQHSGDERAVSPQQEIAPTPLVSAEHQPIEQRHVEHVPKNRRDPLEEVGNQIADARGGSSSNHIMGLLGENALTNYLGIEERLNIEVYPDGGDGGADFSFLGASIDVKTVGRHRPNPALTVNAYEPLRADYYALVSRIGESDFRLIGYVPRFFVANAPVMYHDGEPFHIVGQEYLFPFPKL